jgi:hypothetical protein
MTIVGGVGRRRAAAVRRAMLVATAVAACGSLVKMEPPAPNGPRISGLEVVTTRPLAGCRVLVKVHLDTGAGAQMLAGIGWVRLDRRASGSGHETETIEPAPSGDALVSLAPKRRGLYSYQVQVADRAGRWSNVLETRIAVDGAPAEDGPRCA